MDSGQGAAFPPWLQPQGALWPLALREQAKSLTAYWNFSLYSRSLARALLSSSATECEGAAVRRSRCRPAQHLIRPTHSVGFPRRPLDPSTGHSFKELVPHLTCHPGLPSGPSHHQPGHSALQAFIHRTRPTMARSCARGTQIPSPTPLINTLTSKASRVPRRQSSCRRKASFPWESLQIQPGHCPPPNLGVG